MIKAKVAAFSTVIVSIITIAFIFAQIHQFFGSIMMLKYKLAVSMDEFMIMQVSLLQYFVLKFEIKFFYSNFVRSQSMNSFQFSLYNLKISSH